MTRQKFWIKTKIMFNSIGTSYQKMNFANRYAKNSIRWKLFDVRCRLAFSILMSSVMPWSENYLIYILFSIILAKISRSWNSTTGCCYFDIFHYVIWFVLNIAPFVRIAACKKQFFKFRKFRQSCERFRESFQDSSV